MAKKDKFRRGVPYTTCDRTGRVIPYSETVLEWTGLRVDKRVVDPRHPQDFVKTIKDRQLIPGQKYITYNPQMADFNDWILDQMGNIVQDSMNGFIQSQQLVAGTPPDQLSYI